MKQIQHVEAGDKLYILLKDEVKIVTLTDDHINDRSNTSPKFLVDKLRLASTLIENDQVKLEQGYFYNNSFGMSLDYGYSFRNSDVKAFISKESLEHYLADELQKAELIKRSLDHSKNLDLNE